MLIHKLRQECDSQNYIKAKLKSIEVLKAKLADPAIKFLIEAKQSPDAVA